MSNGFMIPENKLVRFDWAIKHILRDKANFDVLEGLLTALLKEDITILNLLETEGNQEEETDKFNRVDLLVEDSQKRKFIIEVQNNRETDYLERLLYGTSKTITESVNLGKGYSDIAKVISVSILYFNLGKGDDYIYYGRTDLLGVHTNHPLVVKEQVQKAEDFEIKIRLQQKNIFPEYYLIHTEKFENVISSPIDEWIYLLKNSEVKENFRSKNIDKAREKLRILNMTSEQRKQYERFLINLASEKDVIETAREEGKLKGEQIGLEKGEQIGLEKGEQIRIKKEDTAIENALRKGKLSPEEISEILEVSLERVLEVKKNIE
ncbi:MAG TPA: Rpn family recombination-promoting nuclease/putative transposase [Leptospiraceae bacterium]|nr:Rpn family recombination-promoting nuclease/putative transposase [Leptospiraceae bacterium]